MRLSRDQAGFTMPIVLMVLLVGTLLSFAAWGAAQGGTQPSGQSRDERQAYAAAEAGVNWYLSRLIYDNAFWQKCTTVAGPAAPVNDPWNGTNPDPRRWRSVPDSGADYAVELLPANGASACNTANPTGSMIDPATGTFRIRATGRFNGDKRSIVATMRRTRFLDFLYLTKFETTDPNNYPSAATRASAATNCADKLRAARPNSCSEIQFPTGDSINGPMHSDDTLLVCGSPVFGRTKADSIEVPGRVAAGGCSDSSQVLGTPSDVKRDVQFPSDSSNDQLQAAALSKYSPVGTTYVTLNPSGSPANSVRIQTYTSATASTTRVETWPANGLLYVGTAPSNCSNQPPAVITYDRTSASSPSFGCANVFVSGTYGKDITIASDNDVIVNGSLTQVSGSDAVAGLIARRFVRVFHPVSSLAAENGGCSGANQTGSLTDLNIEAAILAQRNSFTVDNFRCGAGLGALTVTGGIAQYYRGAVGSGTPGTSGGTGYLKDYNYDDRLTYRNPPYFLTPDNATWRVIRSSEQVPAR